MSKFSAQIIKSAVFATALAFTIPLVTLAEEEVKASESTKVSVTVYNQDFGIVREQRTLNLKEGINFLRFEDVAEKIDPATVSFKSLTAPDSVSVIEQNFQYDVLNAESVLKKSTGKKLIVRHYGTDGRATSDAGVLLAPPQEGGAVMLKTDSGVILNSSGEFEIGELPADMVPKPSLLWKLISRKAGEHSGEIAYETHGMNWHCDYVAVVNEEETQTDLNGWVTIDNQSGATYKKAGIKLLAGDVHLIGPQGEDAFAADAPRLQAAVAEPAFRENSFSEYHLYTLNGQTDLKNNETKQMSLFSAEKIGAKKKYVFDSTTADFVSTNDDASERLQKIATKLEIQNCKDNSLGMPLPKGRVRIFKKDNDGALQLIGEDSIDHTPSDEKLRLLIGNSFDLVGLHKQTNQVIASAKDNHQRTSCEITLRNHKKTEVTVNCVEHASGEWKITASSQPYVKKSAEVFEFAVTVPAGGEAKVTYTVDTKN